MTLNKLSFYSRTVLGKHIVHRIFEKELSFLNKLLVKSDQMNKVIRLFCLEKKTVNVSCHFQTQKLLTSAIVVSLIILNKVKSLQHALVNYIASLYSI